MQPEDPSETSFDQGGDLPPSTRSVTNTTGATRHVLTAGQMVAVMSSEMAPEDEELAPDEIAAVRASQNDPATPPADAPEAG